MIMNMMNRKDFSEKLKTMNVGEKLSVQLNDTRKVRGLKIGLMKCDTEVIVIYDLSDLDNIKPIIQITENSKIMSFFDDSFEMKMMLPLDMNMNNMVTLSIYYESEWFKNFGDSLETIMEFFMEIRCPEVDFQKMDISTNFDNVVGL
jgi:hypothetical protein